jgi:hypothetical protein
MTKFVGSVCRLIAILAITVMTFAPARAVEVQFATPTSTGERPEIVLAQKAQTPASGPACHRCTDQCRVCGMSSRCNDTCMQHGNGMVQAGPGNCSNWFASAGCKQSR